MYYASVPSKQKMNLENYRDKVLGCWTGKNIGGTIGAPFEGQRDMNNATFYTQKLDGKPAPNDDLDLQLIWLLAAEEKGLFHLNERVLGEYWLSHITGPWNEYGVCKANLRNGLFPPLSGSCNNDQWKYSNGAWIRSEIWACLFPGSPDEAAHFAYYDSCCDHCGEGIYAEIFTATMESAAFVVNDIRQIINIGLSRIPADCRVARSVKLACECYDGTREFKDAREALVRDSADLGWFQAPANLGFVILGLLYGKGDFGHSVCLANNCGDDTDCTAGTVGAIMGIILGRSGIPDKWTAPIGETIQTCSIDTYGRNNLTPLPATLDELTDRVISLAISAQRENTTLLQIGDVPAAISPDYLAGLLNAEPVITRIWNKSPYELAFDLPFGKISFDYENGPYITSGEPKRITIKISQVRFIEKLISVKLRLPEGWSCQGTEEVILNAKHECITSMDVTLIPGVFSGAYYYLEVEIRLVDRNFPVVINLPLQRRDCLQFFSRQVDYEFYDAMNRSKSRIGTHLR